MEAKTYVFEDAIPGDYKTYTLFLIPSDSWSTERQDIVEEELWNNFYKFGEGIGSDNLSVWFVESHKSEKCHIYESANGTGVIEPPKTFYYRKVQPIEGVNTDIRRCKDYCDKFELNYNEGPFLVITEKHPDVCSKKDISVVKFNNLTPNKVILFLNEVQMNIRTGKQKKGVSRFTYVLEILNTWISEHKEDITKLVTPIKVTIP